VFSLPNLTCKPRFWIFRVQSKVGLDVEILCLVSSSVFNSSIPGPPVVSSTTRKSKQWRSALLCSVQQRRFHDSVPRQPWEVCAAESRLTRRWRRMRLFSMLLGYPWIPIVTSWPLVDSL
jgi:hypothetical protein